MKGLCVAHVVMTVKNSLLENIAKCSSLQGWVEGLYLHEVILVSLFMAFIHRNLLLAALAPLRRNGEGLLSYFVVFFFLVLTALLLFFILPSCDLICLNSSLTPEVTCLMNQECRSPRNDRFIFVLSMKCLVQFWQRNMKSTQCVETLSF